MTIPSSSGILLQRYFFHNEVACPTTKGKSGLGKPGGLPGAVSSSGHSPIWVLPRLKMLWDAANAKIMPGEEL